MEKKWKLIQQLLQNLMTVREMATIVDLIFKVAKVIQEKKEFARLMDSYKRVYMKCYTVLKTEKKVTLIFSTLLMHKLDRTLSNPQPTKVHQLVTLLSCQLKKYCKNNTLVHMFYFE